MRDIVFEDAGTLSKVEITFAGGAEFVPSGPSIEEPAGGDITISPATPTADGLMSAADKSKLDGVETEANKYVHPTQTAHASGLYKIATDETGHVSDAAAVAKEDLTALGLVDENTTYDPATGTAAGLMSSEDKMKLDGIEQGANAYTHPGYADHASGLYKVAVDASGHVSDAVSVTKEDITGLGVPGQDTNYEDATQSAHGLMTAADKTKLDGVATGADVSTIESISLNGTTVAPDANKNVNIEVTGGGGSSEDEIYRVTFSIISSNWDGDFYSVSLSGDKTYDDILSAYEAGKFILACVESDGNLVSDNIAYISRKGDILRFGKVEPDVIFEDNISVTYVSLFVHSNDAAEANVRTFSLV